MVKLSLTSLLLLIPSAVAVPSWGFDYRADGGDALFSDPNDNHKWCCIDAGCMDSCKIGNVDRLAKGSNVLMLPTVEGVSPSNTVLWTYEERDYTIWEVYMNTDGIATHFCEYLFGYTCLKGGYGRADPHFKTWGGESYDFHGECDLVWMNAPNFGKGLGLDIHIRTKMRHGYSFIESAAMKIGDDVLEVHSYGDYTFNGVSNADLEGAQMGPFDLFFAKSHDLQMAFDIITEGEQVIKITTFKDFVNIKVEKVNIEDFTGSKGMLGAYPSGKRIDRAGTTILVDPNEFGQEWQVLADEPSLFTTRRAPQSADGERCILPDTTATQSRRLGESKITQQVAEKACAHFQEPDQRKMCVFDVMATGDLDMASAEAF